MLWVFMLALGLSALWYGVDSAEWAEGSDEALQAGYGMTWHSIDLLAYGPASDLAAARLAARAQGVPPARKLAQLAVDTSDEQSC